MSEPGPLPREQCIREYNHKLHAKSRSGEYRIVEMNYEDDAKKVEKKKETNNETKKDEVQSSLDNKVQDLMRLIFDMKMMNNQMK
jgi:poly [ADP-ribose] polymerase